ncbi:penicillin acylase family protein [Candidatus Palauibacter sp.]|uniref:penicillin acylase family protein n=1 Tax=Candidatus Palauibacter sp. TaxID=3101350 RepID=UPI003B0254CA
MNSRRTLGIGAVLLAVVSAWPAAAANAQEQVTIHRDPWGVPHIIAESEEAGFYGLGWAQADDQLEFILTMFLSARGEAAAAYGAETAPRVGNPLAADAQARMWRHAEEARAGWERLSPQLRRNYAHYVAGMEAWMRAHPDRTPDWAPDLEPWDPVALSRFVLWGGYQAGQGLQDCARGGVRLATADREAAEAGARGASNEWVLAPWRTRDDAMIVLSDPHGGIDGAFSYESRLHAGDLHAAGYSLGPMLILTHTRDVSWGMTTGAPDVADCYEVEVDPADSLRYRYDGEWRRMETHEAVIEVRGGEPITRTFAYTRHNEVLSPVVAREEGKAWVVSTAYMHTAGDFDQEVYEINRASSIAEVKQAMRRLGMFPQNVMFGDRHGDSWYIRAGRTPVRPNGFDWNRPLPGNTSASAWLGTHPLEDLVQLETPAAGYMQNNNISPDVMLEASPLTADRYPSYIYNDRSGRRNTRGVRAVEVLSGAWDFTFEEAVELSLDEKWVGTEAWREALRQALEAERDRVRAASPHLRTLARRILSFDGHARQASRAAHAYLVWREQVFSLPDVDEEAREALGGPIWEKGGIPAAHLPRLVDALEAAVEFMLETYGSVDRTLGDVFRIGRGGRTWPLGGLSILDRSGGGGCAVDLGCVFTLRAMTAGAPDSLGLRHVQSGSRLLRLVQFTDPIRSFTLHNYGQSENPDSPHYVDQARLTSERRLKPTYFDPAELMNHVVSTEVLDVSVP